MVFLPRLNGRRTMGNGMIQSEENMARPGVADHFDERFDRKIAYGVGVRLCRSVARLRLRGPVEHHTICRLDEPVGGRTRGTSLLLLCRHVLSIGGGSQLHRTEPKRLLAVRGAQVDGEWVRSAPQL